MLHLIDRAALLAARHLPLAPELHDLLIRRVATLAEVNVLDLTEICVVDATTSEADIIEALGFGLSNPIDSIPAFDLAYRVGAYLVGIHLVGDSGFAFELVFTPDADPALRAIAAKALS